LKRVVITGAGTINAIGQSVPETFEAMREGRCGIGPLAFRDVERLAIQIGGQVRGYDEVAHFNRQQIALYDRFTPMEYNLRGPSFTVSTACASSNHAMAQAFAMIRAGMADVMLTGGSESMLCFGGVKAWEGLRVMSKDACRPFSANRNGMVQGEGAGVFVFEELEHARARGAEILCEVAGFATKPCTGI